MSRRREVFANRKPAARDYESELGLRDGLPTSYWLFVPRVKSQ